VPLSAVDSVAAAIEHVQQQLFRPFRLTQWTLIAFVGLLAGESCSGGALHFNPGSLPGRAGAGRAPDPALLLPFLGFLVLAVPAVWLVLLYLNSRMRFVLFDSVVEKRCSIGRMWRERRQPALAYFLWQILLSLTAVAGTVALVGFPLGAAFLLGWFRSPVAHLAPLVLTAIAVASAFALWLLLFVLVQVFSKDFVVPQMALENITAFEGWRRLWPMLGADKRGYAAYGAMKLVLALAAAFVVAFLAFFAVLILLVPFGGLAAVAVMAGKVAGLGWNVFTITGAIVAASVLAAVMLYVVSLVSVPVIVFFPAFAIHFFAARYALLANLLHPPGPPGPAEPAPL